MTEEEFAPAACDLDAESRTHTALIAAVIDESGSGDALNALRRNEEDESSLLSPVLFRCYLDDEHASSVFHMRDGRIVHMWIDSDNGPWLHDAEGAPVLRDRGPTQDYTPIVGAALVDEGMEEHAALVLKWLRKGHGDDTVAWLKWEVPAEPDPTYDDGIDPPFLGLYGTLEWVEGLPTTYWYVVSHLEGDHTLTSTRGHVQEAYAMLTAEADRMLTTLAVFRSNGGFDDQLIHASLLYFRDGASLEFSTRVLGDLIRDGDDNDDLGGGRRFNKTNTSELLGISRETMNQIRKGTAWAWNMMDHPGHELTGERDRRAGKLPA